MKILRLGLAGLLWSAGAVAQNADGPIRWKPHDGVRVIMRTDTKPIPILTGDTSLTKPISFTCHSAAGCVVVLTASTIMDGNQNSTWTCSYVDDVQATPACPHAAGYGDQSNEPNIRQMAKVAQGIHTAQTRVTADAGAGAIIGWEVQYTIYERKVKGAS